MNHLLFNCIILLIFYFSLCHATTFHRNVKIERAPGCSNNGHSCDINVFHVTADGPNDTLHYIWDFTTKPSLLVAHTKLNTSLSINWTQFFKSDWGSVHFTPEPAYSFMVTLFKLVEFDDTDDIAHITRDSKNVSYDLSSFNWTLKEASETSVLKLSGMQKKDKDQAVNGSVEIEVATFGWDGHDTILPRLLHSANSSQMRVLLENLMSNSGFQHSRWALDLVIASSFSCNKNLSVDFRKNLDDENSPGVFAVYEILTPVCHNMTDERGFLHWRPVTYTAREPSISNSSDVEVMEPTRLIDSVHKLSDTLAYKFYGPNLSDILIEHTIVSFGSSQDGFYKKTNFTSWAFLVSYGTPQTEGFSMLVLLVMGIGLGLPAVLSIVGGLVMCARRFAGRRDELSLER